MRIFAWLAVVAIVIGSVGGYLHLAAVAHAECAEHGESYHVGLGTSALADSHAATTEGHLHGAGTASGHGEAHEHCSVSASDAPRTERVSNNLVSIPLSVLVAPGWLGYEPVVARNGRLLLAPKTSPPVAVC